MKRNGGQVSIDAAQFRRNFLDIHVRVSGLFDWEGSMFSVQYKVYFIQIPVRSIVSSPALYATFFPPILYNKKEMGVKKYLFRGKETLI